MIRSTQRTITRMLSLSLIFTVFSITSMDNNHPSTWKKFIRRIVASFVPIKVVQAHWMGAEDELTMDKTGAPRERMSTPGDINWVAHLNPSWKKKDGRAPFIKMVDSILFGIPKDTLDLGQSEDSYRGGAFEVRANYHNRVSELNTAIDFFALLAAHRIKGPMRGHHKISKAINERLINYVSNTPGFQFFLRKMNLEKDMENYCFSMDMYPEGPISTSSPESGQKFVTSCARCINVLAKTLEAIHTSHAQAAQEAALLYFTKKYGPVCGRILFLKEQNNLSSKNWILISAQGTSNPFMYMSKEEIERKNELFEEYDRRYAQSWCTQFADVFKKNQ